MLSCVPLLRSKLIIIPEKPFLEMTGVSKVACGLAVTLKAAFALNETHEPAEIAVKVNRCVHQILWQTSRSKNERAEIVGPKAKQCKTCVRVAFAVS